MELATIGCCWLLVATIGLQQQYSHAEATGKQNQNRTFVPFAMFKEYWDQDYEKFRPLGRQNAFHHQTCAVACLMNLPFNAFTSNAGCQLGLVTGEEKFYVKMGEVNNVPSNKIIIYIEQSLIAPPPAQIPIDATIWVTNPNCQDGSHEIHFTLKSSQRISIILSNNESNVSHPCEFILDLRRPHSIDLFDCAGPEIRGKTLLAFNSSHQLLEIDGPLSYYLTWKNGILEFGRDEPGSQSDMILFKHMHFQTGAFHDLKTFYEPQRWIEKIGFTAEPLLSSFFSYDPNCYERNFRELGGHFYRQKYKTTHKEMIFNDFSNDWHLEFSHQITNDVSQKVKGKVHLLFIGENYVAFDVKVLNGTHNQSIPRPENKSVLISFDINVDRGVGKLIELNLNESVPILDEANKDAGIFRSAQMSSFDIQNEAIVNQWLTPMKCDLAEMSQLCRIGQFNIKHTIDAKIFRRGFSFPFGPFDRNIFGFGVECTTETQDSCETIWKPIVN